MQSSLVAMLMSHASPTWFPLQSVYANSHSSRMLLLLQSALLPAAMSQMSRVPLLLQSSSGSHSSGISLKLQSAA